MNPAEPAPWGPGVTFAWAVLAMVAGQAAGLVALVLWLGDAMLGRALYQSDGPVLALTTLVTCPVQVGVLVWVARRRGWRARDYLGLVVFRRQDFAIGLAACAALVVAISIHGLLSGRDFVTPFQIETYISTPNAPWLAALFLALVVGAPLSEEITFRGFLFRGWARPDGNPTIAIIAISALWAIMHLQYDWIGMLQIFLIGIVLGWIRWRSGSTLLTFVLHALLNIESSIETVIAVNGM
jgi:membrane protease YdiL (CAAX protease family)